MNNLSNTRKFPALFPWLIFTVFILSCAIPERFIITTDRDLIFPPEITNLGFEEILFPADDGTMLYGWYLPGQPELPLVLFFQGTATNLSYQHQNLAAMQKLGVAIFVFDYRGFGRSQGEPSEEGIYQDARGALAYISKRGWQSERIVYFGRSMGAAIALQLALEKPPAGLILESPFTSLVALINYHYPLVTRLFPWAFEEHFRNRSKIVGLRSPLLILHGDRDEVVPLTMAHDLYARAPSPKTLRIISGAGHGNTFLVGGDGYWQIWQAFLDQIVSGHPIGPVSKSTYYFRALKVIWQTSCCLSAQ